MYRFQFIWDTPNIAGLVLSGCCSVLLPYSCLIKYPNKIVRTTLLGLLFVVYILLLATQSRGALFGFSLSILIFLLLWRQTGHEVKYTKIQRVLQLIAISLCFLIIWPNAAVRFGAIGNLSTDLGINTRLVLWRSACIMTHDNPCGGVDFGSCFAEWFQPSYLRGYFETPISDPLSLAVKYGIYFLSLIILIYNYLIIFLIIDLRRSNVQSPCRMAILLFLISYAVSSLFSTVLISLTGELSLLIAVTVIFINISINIREVKLALRHAIYGSVIVSAVGMVLFLYCCYSMTLKSNTKIIFKKSEEFAALRGSLDNRKILIIDGTGSERKAISHSQMRYWLNSGWKVGLIQISHNDRIVVDPINQWVVEFGWADLLEINGLSIDEARKLMIRYKNLLSNTGIIYINMDESFKIGRKILVVHPSDNSDLLINYQLRKVSQSQSDIDVPWQVTWPRQISKIMPIIISWANSSVL
jgi:hypothetical protein